ncbi:GAF domain-containing protein [Nocardioides caricicola]|uniref:GAF domain-containing protein n=1 Tax=Nocardioides caricicola TaxID=634770 RepID=A0ABW0N1P8_9ACTN
MRVQGQTQQLEQVTTVTELADVVRTYARIAARAHGATFVLREDDLCYYVDEDAISPLWKGQRFPITSCISGWAMLHATPVAVPDIDVDERIPLEAYRPTFVRSLYMVPVGAQRPVAAIGAYWARAHVPTEPEQERLLALADAAAEVLVRIGLDTAP